MNFNLNNHVRVKLTAEGRNVVKRDFESTCGVGRATQANYKAVAPKEDAEGWSEWKLWELMRMFGPHLNLGVLDVMGTEIEIVTDEREPVTREMLRIAALTSGPDRLKDGWYNGEGCAPTLEAITAAYSLAKGVQSGLYGIFPTIEGGLHFETSNEGAPDFLINPDGTIEVENYKC